MNIEQLRPYAPAGITLALAFFFLIFPALAVFLVVGALFTFAVLYSFVVYKLRKMQSYASKDYVDPEFKEAHDVPPEPNFKNVTVYMIKKGNWFEQGGVSN